MGKQKITLSETWILMEFKAGWLQNMLFWHTDYFELKLFKKQPVQKGHSDLALYPWKPEINLLSERLSGGEETSLSPENGIQGQSLYKHTLLLLLIYYQAQILFRIPY